MRSRMRRLVLMSLLSAGGTPMSEAALCAAVDLGMRPAEATRSDIEMVIRDCEAEGMIQGITDEMMGERTWSLTVKGEHRARGLR